MTIAQRSVDQSSRHNCNDESGSVWHALDPDDVAVSMQALEAIKDVARKVLPRYVPAETLDSLTVADSLTLLSREMFWEEQSDALLLCANLGDRNLCLDIPAHHWRFQASGPLH